MFSLIINKIQFRVSCFYLLFILTLLNVPVAYAQQNSGEELFNESYVHEIRIHFAASNFWEMLTENYNNGLDQIDPDTGELAEETEKVYLQADIEIDGNSAGMVGIRQKGYFSNWGAGDSQKKSLKIDFNAFVAGNSYDGLKKLNLHNGFQDPSMMRDAVAYKLFRANGIPAPRTSYVKLYLNDVYWGLYLMVEQIDKTFLEAHFANNDGNLFKCDGTTSLLWEGTDVAAYSNDFDLKTNETENDWTNFIDFLDVVNNTAEEDFEFALQETFVLDDYVKILALDVMMNNWDSYYGQGRNFYLYFDTVENKFHWLPWDYNLSFMNYETELLLGNAEAFFGEAYTEKILTKKILENENLRLEYLQNICKLKQEYFNLDFLEAYIDETKALIEEDLNTDPNKFFTMSAFENGTEERPALKTFLENRLIEIENEFEVLNFNCFGLNSTSVIPEKKFHIYPNPVSKQQNLTINATGGQNTYVSLLNTLGVTLYSNQTNEQRLKIQIKNYPSGIYFLEIQQEGQRWRRKIIIK